MKDNNEPWKDEPWYKLMYNDVPGQIIIEAMPVRPREKPRPVNKKTIEEEVKNIKVEIAIGNVEDALIEDVISVLATEEEEIENSAAELLTDNIEEGFIYELIGDMALLTSMTLDTEEEVAAGSMGNIIDDLLEESISELLYESQEMRSYGCVHTPRSLRKVVSESRSPSNESDTTAEIVFLSPGSVDSNDGTVVSAFMMGEGANLQHSSY